MKASVLSNCPTNRIYGSSHISRFGASHGSAFRFDGAHGSVFHSAIRHHRTEAAYARPKKPGLAPKRLIGTLADGNEISRMGDISRMGASPGCPGSVSRTVIGHHWAGSPGTRPKKPGLAPKRLICSWSVDAATIDPTTFDLSVKNPNGGEEVTHRSPAAIMDEIAAQDAESADVLATIRRLL